MENKVIYELKIQIDTSNSLKAKTIGDLEELKSNLKELNISRRRNMRSEVTNSFKPLQQAIYTKEIKEVKRLTKDEIIQELRAENAELKILVKQLMVKVDQLTYENAVLVAKVDQLTSENLELKLRITKLESR